MDNNEKKQMLIDLIDKQSFKTEALIARLAIISFMTSLMSNTLTPKDYFLKAIPIIESIDPFINMTRGEILDFVDPFITDRKNITRQNYYFD